MKSLVLILWLALTASIAQAQFISPGKLSKAHADLDGLTNCTSCHRLGQRGIEQALCLDCHKPLAVRVEERQGYHGLLKELKCASCHPEHVGRDFDQVRFDTTSFDHSETGYELLGSHGQVSCRSCHTPDLIEDALVRRELSTAQALAGTWLGLPEACASCHESDSPHDNQFAGVACNDCHDETEWTETPGFDHDLTDYPLTGRHVNVECLQCHEPARAEEPASMMFEGTAFGSCETCHADPHDGSFGAVCSSCHSTAGWSSLPTARLEREFDHASTGFDLVGAHDLASCQSCHALGAPSTATTSLRFGRDQRGKQFPIPAHETCQSCHLDVHENDLPFRSATGTCTDCHGQSAWSPSSFDLLRHNGATRFPLEGGHLAVACIDCHVTEAIGTEFHFAREDRSCLSCHGEAQPHGDQFREAGTPIACETCHEVDSWDLPDYPHEVWPLDGRHVDVVCADCHRPADIPGPPIVYAGLDQACESCHEADDPHQGQFVPAACITCHDTGSFRIAAFDHTISQFPLEGAHQSVACASCHPSETARDGRSFVRFKPLDTRCIACHGQ